MSETPADDPALDVPADPDETPAVLPLEDPDDPETPSHDVVLDDDVPEYPQPDDTP